MASDPQPQGKVTYTFTKDDLLKLEAVVKIGLRQLPQEIDPTDLEGAEKVEALYSWMLFMKDDITTQLRGME